MRHFPCQGNPLREVGFYNGYFRQGNRNKIAQHLNLFCRGKLRFPAHIIEHFNGEHSSPLRKEIKDFTYNKLQHKMPSLTKGKRFVAVDFD